jgi:hypothetical protein
LYFLKKQPGHAEFISASHQDGYPIYRQFIAKHVFYFASEMPICIGMTLILFLPNTYGLEPSGGLKRLLLGWSKRLSAFLDKLRAVVGVVTNNLPCIPLFQSFTLLNRCWCCHQQRR